MLINENQAEARLLSLERFRVSLVQFFVKVHNEKVHNEKVEFQKAKCLVKAVKSTF